MHKIRDWLYIGDANDAANYQQMRHHGIGALLQLATDHHYQHIRNFILLVDDGVSQTPENLATGIRFIRQQKAVGESVLVTCQAGVSRSTTYALGALREEEDTPLLDLLVEIKRHHHPAALPHIRLWGSLTSYYDEKTPYQDIWRTLRQDKT